MADPVVFRISCEVNEGKLESAFAKIEERALLCAKRVKETLAGVPGADALEIVLPSIEDASGEVPPPA